MEWMPMAQLPSGHVERGPAVGKLPADARRSSRRRCEDWARYARIGITCLGIVGTLLATEQRAAAQVAIPDTLLQRVRNAHQLEDQGEWRLTVRPRAMATGTRTDRAGDQQQDSIQPFPLYVPTRCVGTRRCPLLVFAPSGAAWEMQRPLAEKHGIILLWFEAPQLENSQMVPTLDTVLQQILQRFAIDPDKIAVAGISSGGVVAMNLGGHNEDVFSRVALHSMAGAYWGWGPKPHNKATQFFVEAGITEDGFLTENARRLYFLRDQEGHRVKSVVGIKGHENRPEMYDFMYRLLLASWGIPDPAGERHAKALGSPAPVLTTDGVRRFTTFWTRFMQEPDSIKTTARLDHLREFTVPVGLSIGLERASVWMVDIPGLAARYPTVATDLRIAGLTAQQAEGYRAALISAKVTESIAAANPGWQQLSPPKRSVAWKDAALEKNVLFFRTHTAELTPLAEADIWGTP